LILLGPPGAGKGTQARRLAAHYQLSHLASGDLLRSEIEADTALGRKVAPLVAAGQLVPDALMIPIIGDHIARLPHDTGFVLDGFPRTLNQATELDRMLASLQRPLDAVVLLDVPDDVVRERLLARQRPDDVRPVIEERLEIYHDQIDPLLDYYAAAGRLRVVDGTSDEETVFRDLVRVLELSATSS
jgi:adenylate kinase